MEFFKQQFDKLLLAFLFLTTLGIATWLQIRPGMDEGAIDWARHNGDLAMGALLGIITGKGIDMLRQALLPPKEDPK
jgi:hypothetical protein